MMMIFICVCYTYLYFPLPAPSKSSFYFFSKLGKNAGGTWIFSSPWLPLGNRTKFELSWDSSKEFGNQERHIGMWPSCSRCSENQDILNGLVCTWVPLGSESNEHMLGRTGNPSQRSATNWEIGGCLDRESSVVFRPQCEILLDFLRSS